MGNLLTASGHLLERSGGQRHHPPRVASLISRGTIEPDERSARLTCGRPQTRVLRGQASPAPPQEGLVGSFYVRECVMSSEDVVPPLAANMNAAFKKVRGAIGATDPALADLIVTRIVELAKDGVYDIEELSSRTLSSLKLAG
jgi:hypothetical protein